VTATPLAARGRREVALRLVVLVLGMLALLAAPASAKVVKVTEGGGFYGTVLAQLPNGRLLAGGALNVGRKQVYAVARFSRNGRRDKSFGTRGLARARPGNGDFEDLRALIPLPDGRIVGIGNSNARNERGFVTLGIGVARWTANGRPDTTFGGGDGVAHHHFGEDNPAFAILFRGGFVIGGQSYAVQSDVFHGFVGGRDASFGPLPGWTDHTSAPGDLDSPYFLAAQESDGGIVLAYGGTGRDASNRLTLSYGIARLNADGAYDTSFGDGGWSRIDYGRVPAGQVAEIHADLVRRPGGGWLLGATAIKPWALSAWTAQGQPDRSWAGGRLDYNADGGKRGEIFGKFLPLARGAVLAGGNGGDRLLFGRFKRNGSVDRRFGRRGRLIQGFETLGYYPRAVSGLAAQPRGKVVVLSSGRLNVTTARETLVLLRLKRNGALDPKFGR
jgi:uncharacterized delta-60 repeat protein